MKFKAFKQTELSPFVRQARITTTGIIIILIAFLFLPWQQTTKGTGTLIAYEPSQREYNVLAPISGFIKKYYIEENKFVIKGDSLFDMIDLDAQYLEKVKSIIDDIKVQHKNVQSSLEISHGRKQNLFSNLKTSLEIYNKEIMQIEELLKSLNGKKISQKNNFEIATSNYERVKLLHLEGIESKRTYEVVKNEYIKEGVIFDNITIDIEIKTKSLEIRKKKKERFIKEQENDIKLLENSIISSENKLKYFEQEIKKISIDLSRNNTSKVVASKDGYPLRILKNDTNLYVKKGEPVVHFAPQANKRALLLKVRLLDMPLIKKGLQVRVQFHGWPSLQVSGWPKIKFGTFGGVVDKIDYIAHEKGVFYAYIVEDPLEPWPSSEVLKIGTEATGWVRLSTVSIGYEMWRMHNAQPPIMINNGENYK
ncbi:hypothetical protein HUE87_07615 [Candidatus Sulfurimonas marisnigri]|uniref:HlyD family efflux transporter periplasmic adaptor subunit n=1 Tax=Candidatus Sulfurimonas marisnigri TaxID=2740405 RepID=A0A7S7LYF2_9BACT|nr:hypothetical protein [Candidatus Sulfurimonas marisnigri]QOY53768.1 hypothetical protein HUE87_07615 [Candidatus Sulfurimonas marisnigri]